jgi:hypothetical protein
MTHLIDKDTTVAEINRLIAELVEKGEGTMFEQGRISAFEDAKLFLDTLEMKEVDLEKEINRIDDSVPCRKEDIEYIAKHFFELGLKAAQK